ncbi:MAG: UDP-N-acetylmuramoyl-L-alanine--D-glutamate ligase [Candidatus Spechtbacterales bacterium]
MKDFLGKKITLMGLGLNGGAIEDALFFIKQGANLTVTDLKTEEELEMPLKKIKKYNVNLTLGKHIQKDFLNADLIIKNPAVRKDSKYLALARSKGIKINTSIELFFELANTKKLIGITGTKGKSTTAVLIYKIIKTKYPNTYLAGNMGVSPLKYADRAQRDIGIIELSSFQLEGLKKSPHISVITNIGRDHLNRYKNFSDYARTKKTIFRWQDKNDILVINNALRSVTKNAQSKVVLFSGDNIKIKNPKIHPDNISAAIHVAKIMRVSKKTYEPIIKNFKGLKGRLEYIGSINKAEIFNDTTATNPMSAINSLQNFKNKKIALIAGGEDKNLDYNEFSKNLKGVYVLALLPGSASDKIYMCGVKNKTWNPRFKKVKNLEEALKYSLGLSPEIILLSPAAASFNMFANEFERGSKFADIVKKYGAKSKTFSR